MFNKVLIANRGEIAVRIARTCHELGIGIVAVYSDADRLALHVRVADEAYRIGPPPARESYLNIDAIMAVAAESKAQAIHPGYGFLAENAEFAERVEAAGIAFIGPAAAAIRAMGDKAKAKRLMIDAGVPVVPGYQGEDQDDRRLRTEADRIGYPLLIKAAAGGGGRGMREVREPAQFQEQLEGARRESLAAFGDATMLLERLVEGARHVEVQVFGDRLRNMIHLGERDCSIQRRHQKVIEESPSPAVNDELRDRMGTAAVRAAARVGYSNAGTVEFLLAENAEFYFLEMNTRLQVEHPVTELVTGLDLVKLQLEVAAGAPLPYNQAQVTISGHAIEARLYAEDPANAYLPSAGTLRRYRLPAGARLDSGFSEGATISPYYDSLLAKIIVHGADRHEAVGRLVSALADTEVAGVMTNLPLLRAIASSSPFASGAVTTEFLDRQGAALLKEEPIPTLVVLGAAGFLLTDAGEDRSSVGEPWQSIGPWRVGGARRVLPLVIDGRVHRVSACSGDGPGEWLLAVDATEQALSIDRLSSHELLMRRGPEVTAFTVHDDGGAGRLLRFRDTEHRVGLAAPTTPDVVAASVRTDGISGLLLAPMPGTVAKLNIAVGDTVKEWQPLAVLEAMKMEHAIQATMNGRVKAVHCREGDRVSGGAVLIELEPVASGLPTHETTAGDVQDV